MGYESLRGKICRLALNEGGYMARLSIGRRTGQPLSVGPSCLCWGGQDSNPTSATRQPALEAA